MKVWESFGCHAQDVSSATCPLDAGPHVSPEQAECKAVYVRSVLHVTNILVALDEGGPASQVRLPALE